MKIYIFMKAIKTFYYVFLFRRCSIDRLINKRNCIRYIEFTY